MTIQIPYGRYPEAHIITGGQPSRADFQKAKEAGVTMVINLRTMGESPEVYEEAIWMKELGLDYVFLPVMSEEGVSVANAKRIHEAIQKNGTQPVIIHCATGNRVGALLAMKAFHCDGKSKDDALAYGKKSGLASLEPFVIPKLTKAL